MRDDNSAFSEAWGIAHVKAGYTLALQDWAIEACAGVQNVTNTRYAAMVQVNATAFGSQLPRYYYPGLPRNAYLEVRVKRSF
jgi:iron complex outermembrane receptor protein